MGIRSQKLCYDRTHKRVESPQHFGKLYTSWRNIRLKLLTAVNNDAQNADI